MSCRTLAKMGCGSLAAFLVSTTLAYASCQASPTTYNYNRTVSQGTLFGSTGQPYYMSTTQGEYFYYYAYSEVGTGSNSPSEVQTWIYPEDECVDTEYGTPGTCQLNPVSTAPGYTGYGSAYDVQPGTDVYAEDMVTMGGCPNSPYYYHYYVGQGEHEFTFGSTSYTGWSENYS